MINAPYSPTCLFLHQYASSEARVSSQSGTLMVYNADITGLIDKAKVEQVDRSVTSAFLSKSAIGPDNTTLPLE